MTFEAWWKDNWHIACDSTDDQIALMAWNAALEAAAKHFDGYTWSPYKNPSITIREMLRASPTMNIGEGSK